jgi:hypothetical protein
MANRYEYKPLNPSTSDIRLLKLLPNDRNDKLKNIPVCQIFRTSLDRNPKFVALSYVWGDTNSSRIILVETCPMRVTTNLYDALMAIRPSKEPIIIWIDFLCINQSDTGEKCWQVALMGNIYRQAQKVIAWLGPADDSSNAVMDYLNELGQRADACGLTMGPEICLRLWLALASNPPAIQEIPGIVASARALSGGNNSSIPAIQDLLHSIDGWHSRNNLLPMAGLKRLLSRPWWGRVWVLQEIALSHHAEFVCGTKTISQCRFSAAYNAYYAFWEFLALRRQQGQILTGYHMEVLLLALHRSKLMLSAWRIWALSNFPLLAMLRATSVGSVHHLGIDVYQHLESTDPRDKIHALLALSKDREDLERRGVLPNYEKSKEVVFISVTAALLQQGHVSILSFCRHLLQHPLGLPSWVSDWSQPMPETLQDVENDHMTLTPRFNASGVTNGSRGIIISRSSEVIDGISVQCHLYDTIHQVGTVRRDPVTGTCMHPFDWLYVLLRLTYEITNAYIEFQHRLSAVVGTSCGGITSGYDELLERAKDDRLDTRCLEVLHILEQGMHNIAQQVVRRELEEFSANKQVPRPIQNEAEKVTGYLCLDYMRVSPKRAPFVTKKGHPGLSSRHVRRGDIVALVHGAEVPFILRSQPNGKHIIVSEAYVDGIMDGEAAKGARWESLAFI